MPQLKNRRIGPRWLALAVGSLVAGIATVLARRRSPRPVLPDPAGLAGPTATSVQNAAKGMVIAAVRSAEHPDGLLVSETVQAAIREAAEAGTDLVPAAIGATQGAMNVARLFGESALAAGQRAAAAAVQEAETVSEVAGLRLRDVLSAYLEQPVAQVAGGSEESEAPGAGPANRS